MTRRLSQRGLNGRRIVVTAGPTREYLDPVRYLSNESSGEMGIAIAESLAERGARVHLVAGPISLPSSASIDREDVVSAQQMARAVKRKLPRCDAFISTAAVADYRPDQISSQKLKKVSGPLRLSLVPNPDILREAGEWKRRHGDKLVLVGFALETKELKKSAQRKLQRKNLDLIIGNSPATFRSHHIRALWIDARSGAHLFPRMTKRALAQKISQFVSERLWTNEQLSSKR